MSSTPSAGSDAGEFEGRRWPEGSGALATAVALTLVGVRTWSGTSGGIVGPAATGPAGLQHSPLLHPATACQVIPAGLRVYGLTDWRVASHQLDPSGPHPRSARQVLAAWLCRGGFQG
jgi:hypothetical protein